MSGKETFTQLAEAAEKAGMNEKDSKKFAFTALAALAAFVGADEADKHFQERAKEVK